MRSLAEVLGPMQLLANVQHHINAGYSVGLVNFPATLRADVERVDDVEHQDDGTHDAHRYPGQM